MYRGSTPTHIFSDIGIDLTSARVYLTYSQFGRVVVEKTNEDMTIEADKVTVKLTQEETLKFKSDNIAIQMRYVMSDGMADASNIVSASASKILKDGVIEWS